MAVYYFHFRNEGRHSMPDLYGERLPDLTAAEAFARQTARDLAESDDADRWRGWRVEVADDEGAVLTKVPVFARSSYH